MAGCLKLGVVDTRCLPELLRCGGVLMLSDQLAILPEKEAQLRHPQRPPPPISCSGAARAPMFAWMLAAAASERRYRC